MRILLSNDDGIPAPGLAALNGAVADLGEVTVVAPSSPQSAAGHSITLKDPLTVHRVRINDSPRPFWGNSVDGRPADCVRLAVRKLLAEWPDLVLSGINAGANVGINVFYSGTVAAAMEAALLKIPSVALSLAVEQEMDFARAATHCASLLGRLLPIEAGGVININVPLLSKGEPKGVRVVPQSTTGFDEHYISKANGGSEALFQLAGGLIREEAEPADTLALTEGFITVTPLIADMTDHVRIASLQSVLLGSDRESR